MFDMLPVIQIGYPPWHSEEVGSRACPRPLAMREVHARGAATLPSSPEKAGSRMVEALEGRMEASERLHGCSFEMHTE